MPLKPGQELRSAVPQLSSTLFNHPAQRENARHIVQLITWLRSCEQPADYYELQRYLFGYLYQVEERRALCSQAIKRLRRGRPAPTATPAPHDGDPTALDSWELEAFIYERLARQLRTVGDGLAWRCFGYDRRMILTLCRNAAAGPMYGKEGLPYELGRIQELWEKEGASPSITT